MPPIRTEENFINDSQQVHSATELFSRTLELRYKAKAKTNKANSSGFKRSRSDGLSSAAPERKRICLHITYKNAERDRLAELEYLRNQKVCRISTSSSISASSTITTRITSSHSRPKLCLHINYKNTPRDKFKQWKRLDSSSCRSRNSGGGNYDNIDGRDRVVRLVTSTGTSCSSSTGTFSIGSTDASASIRPTSVSASSSSTTTSGQQKRKPMLRITYKNAARDRKRERYYMKKLGRPHP